MRRLLTLSFAALLCACPSNDELPADTGTSTGTPDASNQVDLGSAEADTGSTDADPLDAGAGGADSGAARQDAGADTADTGAQASEDAGSSADAGASTDGGGPEDMGMDGGDEPDLGEDMGSGVVTDDPFDPASCDGTPWDDADALARLGGASQEILGYARVMERSRTCSAAGCDPWGAPQPSSIRYLTWSGGVTTRYKTLPTDTTLVLWNDGGAAKLSVRHDTHVDEYPSDHDRGLTFGLPPQAIRFPYMRAYNVDPDGRYDYLDLENYIGRDAQLFVSPTCARFVSVLPNQAGPVTTEYVALYRF